MANDKKRNLMYFESSSMKELFNQMETWQTENKKRLLHLSVEKDKDKFCCIALTNPSEVIIKDGGYDDRAARVNDRRLHVTTEWIDKLYYDDER